MNRDKKRDIMVSVKDSDIEELDECFVRLYRKLLELKKLGTEPKSRKLTKSIVKSAIFKIGLERVKDMSWEDFNDICERGNIYKRRRS